MFEHTLTLFVITVVFPAPINLLEALRGCKEGIRSRFSICGEANWKELKRRNNGLPLPKPPLYPISADKVGGDWIKWGEGLTVKSG
jgi:hypothetical protein